MNVNSPFEISDVVEVGTITPAAVIEKFTAEPVRALVPVKKSLADGQKPAGNVNIVAVEALAVVTAIRTWT
jgi:hypothetical protein